MMFNKIAGLLSLGLIGTSLIIGPLSYVFSFFNRFKAYRKYLGVSGFGIAAVHVTLSFVIRYKADLSLMLLNPGNPYLLGVYFGLLALFIFAVMTVTSTTQAMKVLGSRAWKMIQTTGYLGLLAVIVHFILMETTKGVFTIRRPLGRVIFVFGCIVLLVRLIVFLRTRRQR